MQDCFVCSQKGVSSIYGCPLCERHNMIHNNGYLVLVATLPPVTEGSFTVTGKVGYMKKELAKFKFGCPTDQLPFIFCDEEVLQTPGAVTDQDVDLMIQEGKLK